MKKEKTIRTYQRRTKTGKIVTVKQHTAKYDAAEALREAAKKKGAGDELEGVKKKGELDLAKIDAFKGDPNELSDKERQAWQILTGNYPVEAESKLRKMKSLEKVWAYADAKSKKKSSAKAPKETKVSKDATDPYSAHGFTKDEFKEWYEGTGSKADKKVEKALKKAMGTKAYNALSDKAADEYKEGGAHRFFTKGLEGMKSVTSKKETTTSKVSKEDEKLSRITKKMEEVASQYGFKKSEADTVARWTGGRGEPNGKLYRKMSDIPQKVVKEYADFEDVSPRQARLEMLGMPTGEYNRLLKEAGITPTKKESSFKKGDIIKKSGDDLRKEGFKATGRYTMKHPDGREVVVDKSGTAKGQWKVTKEAKDSSKETKTPKLSKTERLIESSKQQEASYKEDLKVAKTPQQKQKVKTFIKAEQIYRKALQDGSSPSAALKASEAVFKQEEPQKKSSKSSSEGGKQSFVVAGLRMDPTNYNSRRTFSFDPATGEVHGKWSDDKEKRLTRFLNVGNRTKVANAIEKKFGAEAKAKFLAAATEGKGKSSDVDKAREVIAKHEKQQAAEKRKAGKQKIAQLKEKGYALVRTGATGNYYAKKGSRTVYNPDGTKAMPSQAEYALAKLAGRKPRKLK